MPELPIGTVTFLYTDIEGSTRRWEQYPADMKVAVERHDAILRQAIGRHGGVVFRTMGDAFCASFSVAPNALLAAIDAQLALHNEQWSTQTGPIKVRMALHTGIGEARDGDYVGPPLNRIARLLSAGYGEQILVSHATYDLLREMVPSGTSLRDLGEHRLKDLQYPERIFELVISSLPADFPPLKTLDNRPNNLPVERSLLVGREAELATVERLLLRKETGLLTLTGAGGIGKTRIALQGAAELIDKFQDGVFFVSLAHIADPALVAPAVAQVLGIGEVAGPGRNLVADLADYMRDRQLLLVIDNFEQVLGAAPIISELLAAAPQLKVLATSREMLRLRGEQEFAVPPLNVPDLKHLPSAQALSKYEAVALFIQVARLAKPDFEVTNENAHAVAEICYRLDGLPLAIQLAAARIRLLTPQAMLTRLASSLRLLTGGARDMPERQQTLRSTVQWSYDLLQPAEQMLFRRMAIFVGGCTLEAVEAVCNSDGALQLDVLDGVASLVEKSLIRQEVTADGEPRFVMMATIREYGTELLNSAGPEAEALGRAHAEYYLTVVRPRTTMALRGSGKSHTLGEGIVLSFRSLEIEHSNLSAAMDRALATGDAEMAYDLAAELWWFWNFGGQSSEGWAWLRQVLQLPGSKARPSSRALVLLGASVLAINATDYSAGISYAEESAGIFRELGDEWISDFGLALVMKGNSLTFTGNTEGAMVVASEGMDAIRRGGNEFALQVGLNGQTYTAMAAGDYVLARTNLEEFRALSRKAGTSFGLARAANGLGDVLRILGDYAQAREAYEEALAFFQQPGLRHEVAAIMHNLGYVALAEGDINQAQALFTDALHQQNSLHNLHNQLGISECLAGLAGVAAARGEPERAARLFGAADALREASGSAMWPAEKVDYERNLAIARGQLDQQVWQMAWQEGWVMSMEQAIEYALERTAEVSEHEEGRSRLRNVK